MSDEQPVHSTRKGAGILGILLLWVALALVLYVLSVGPVARYYRGKNPPNMVLAFYSPLEGICKGFPALDKFFDWYFEQWGAR